MKKVKILFLTIIFLPLYIYAQESSNPQQQLDWFLIISTLLGGLALFLYGLDIMSSGLKKSAGNRMRKILAALSKNRFIALLVGALVTMIIQSSSATTVMLVSFVNSGLMEFSRTLAIILGANIGTTITAQIIAFKLTDYAILIIAVGFLIRATSKTETFRNIGDTLLGFGILFYGMELMSIAMKPLRTYQPVIELLQTLKNPVIGVLVGMIFTAIIQSSSAFTGIVIVLAQQHLVGLQEGITLILGANIGTCITAVLASLQANRQAKRVALAHVTFKTLGVLLLIWWIPQYTDFIKSLSPYLGADAGREVANAHTIFNVMTAFLFLPFVNLFAKGIEKVLPDKPIDEELIPTIKHLDYNVLNHPAIAISLARAEISTVIKLISRMLRDILKPFFSKEKNLMDATYKKLDFYKAMEIREKKVDFLEAEITKYLIAISKSELSQKQSNEVFSLITTVNYLETIADIINDDILPLSKKKQQIDADFSEEGKKELEQYHLKLLKQLSRLNQYFETQDISAAKKVIEKWEKYKRLDQEYRIHHYLRMNKNQQSLMTHKIHMELMDHFQQIGFHIDSIAKALMRVEVN